MHGFSSVPGCIPGGVMPDGSSASPARPPSRNRQRPRWTLIARPNAIFRTCHRCVFIPSEKHVSPPLSDFKLIADDFLTILLFYFLLDHIVRHYSLCSNMPFVSIDPPSLVTPKCGSSTINIQSRVNKNETQRWIGGTEVLPRGPVRGAFLDTWEHFSLFFPKDGIYLELTDYSSGPHLPIFTLTTTYSSGLALGVLLFY